YPRQGCRAVLLPSGPSRFPQFEFEGHPLVDEEAVGTYHLRIARVKMLSVQDVGRPRRSRAMTLRGSTDGWNRRGAGSCRYMIAAADSRPSSHEWIRIARRISHDRKT